MTEELLPCPFCGDDEVHFYNVGITSGGVICGNPDCRAKIISEDVEKAIVAWNTRTPPPATVPHIEGLREAANTLWLDRTEEQEAALEQAARWVLDNTEGK